MLTPFFRHQSPAGCNIEVENRLEIDGRIRFAMGTGSDERWSYMQLRDAARLRDWLNEAFMGYILPAMDKGGTNS